ncbi:hypothetical protein KFE94_04255 [bacterium SCSIO 12643]|nr:hypothetical protein KFE94_04255 [bacterium SCSIO 12643]
MKYLSYIPFILVFSFFVSCSANKDLYIAPNFVSDNSLPAKPIFEEPNSEYFSLDSTIFKITLNHSLNNQTTRTLDQKYASLNQFNYQFTLPPFYYSNFSLFHNSFYPEWIPFRYASNFYNPGHPFNTYYSYWSNWSTPYYSLGHCSSYTQRKTTYIKPSTASPDEKSNVRYNLARTSNYNYTTRKRTKTSSGYYNDPKTIPSPVMPSTQTYEYTPYSSGPSKNANHPPKRSSSTYTPKNPKPQATPASSTPSTSPSNTYKQKPTAMPANTPL